MPHPRVSLALLALCGSLAALGPWPAPAAAEPEPARVTVLVLDRGYAGRADGARRAEITLRMASALIGDGADARILVAGSSPEGKPVFREPQPTLAALTALSRDEAYDFRGPTSVDAALDHLLGNVAVPEGAPLDVLLLGPFDPEAAEGAPAPEPGPGAAAWKADAPEGSRIVPLGLSATARAALADLPGLQTKGWFVLGLQKPVVETEPVSPFPPAGGDPGAAPLSARVSITADLLAVDGAGAVPPLFSAKTDLESDTVLFAALDSLTHVDVKRSLRDGRLVTVRLLPRPAEGVTWICAPPDPLTFRWEKLAPGARLAGPDGSSDPRFEALDAQAGTPVTAAFRLRRARTGPTPAWRCPDELPAGLAWTLGEEVAVSPEIAESELRLTFRAQVATPVERLEGVLRLKADGMADELRLPYRLHVPPGRAALVMDAGSVTVPRASEDAGLSFRVEARNANVPPALALRIELDAAHAPWITGRVTTGDGATTPLAEHVPVPVGVALTLSLDVKPDAPATLVWPTTLRVGLAEASGVEADGAAEIEVRHRRPRLVLAGKMPSLRIEDGALVASRPVILRLEPDGGDGEWLLRLMKEAPTIARAEGGIGHWSVVAREPGVWQVVPKGDWSGAAPEIFQDREETVRLTFSWEAGAAPEDLAVPVTVQARWGSKGWMFVGLAGIAILMVIVVLMLMRPPAIRGTLLYTIDGVEGAVGRLDLQPVGRRAAVVSADAKGRLALGSAGTVVARLRPTRVGGMLEVPETIEGTERRLLVDGLTIKSARHTLRYLSGQVSEEEASAALGQVPDLLGPEFDIESGRIGAMDEPAED